MGNDMKLIAATITALLVATTAIAAELATPEGAVILTIAGDGIVTNSDNGAEFDRELLESLPQEVIETTTPWHVGLVKFEGPRLQQILETVGAVAGSAEVTALDGYQIDMPVSDFAEHRPILAIKRDGEYMPDDDQGPLFIIYDYDSDPKLNTEEFHGRSVWSVQRIEFN